jgi:transaldolase
MKFFIDTANIEEIKELNDLGLIDGVTTNPSLIKQSGRNMIEVITEICALVDGPVSAEVVANDFDGMVREGLKLAKISEKIAIKVPLTWDGLKACRYFADQDLMVNVTLCFSAQQALLAAKAGAAFISPFVGRLDDIGSNGMSLIADIAKIYENYYFETEILVASVRSPQHVVDAAKIGADIATIPYKVLRSLAQHPLTDKGLEIFNNDWLATGQKI